MVDLSSFVYIWLNIARSYFAICRVFMYNKTMLKLNVNLGKRTYPVFVGAKLENIGLCLEKMGFSKKALVVTDRNVGAIYLGAVLKSLESSGFNAGSLAIGPGEQNKNIKTIQSIYSAAVKAALDRKSVIIALGGGIVGDLAGFAAATYLRGVPLVQVPTTLLAMVDSSVGGKTGFDLKEGKNLVGAFYQPKVVWIDISTLKTLPKRHISNGLAEVVKYGVIKDATFFNYLEKNIARLDDKILAHIIFRSCQIKARVVEKDEFEEKGLREILNFGHTFGHAAETLSGYRGILHGEAIPAGMNTASRLSVKLGLLKNGQFQRIQRLLSAAGLGLSFKEKFAVNNILKVMMRDKKVRNGKLRLVLPLDIGRVTVKTDISEKLIKEALK